MPMETLKFQAAIVICLAAFLHTGCKKTDEEMMAGKWQLVSIDGNTSYGAHDGTNLVINSNGTFTRKDYVHIVQSQYDLKEIAGTWNKSNSEIVFVLDGLENVTVMVNGYDSTYSRPCMDRWTLVRVDKKELVLAHDPTEAGCFLDSYAGTEYKFGKR